MLTRKLRSVPATLSTRAARIRGTAPRHLSASSVLFCSHAACTAREDWAPAIYPAIWVGCPFTTGLRPGMWNCNV